MAGVRQDRVLQFILQERQNGNTFETVLNYKYGESDPRPTSADLVSLGAAFWAGVRVSWKAATVNNVVFTQVIVKDLSPTNYTEGVFIITPTETGQYASEGLPATNACVLSGHSGRLGKSGQSRTYIGGLPTAAMVSGVLNTDMVTKMQVLAAAIFFFTGNSTFHMLWSVFSRLGHFTNVITSVGEDNLVDTQRRRKIGVGV